jgi:uncharacterized RDD family membrane protein YckC
MEQNPNTPYDPERLNDPIRPNIGRSPAEFDKELQADLAEGPASNMRIALLAVAIAVVLGALFYGLNNSSTHQQNAAAPTSSTAQNAPTTPPAAPPGMRDVTPRANNQPGTTTGSAPANK